MQQITLTGQQILEMATFAGIMIDEKYTLDDAEKETEFELSCNMEGIEINCEDEPEGDGKYTHAIWIAEYPEEGVLPLGEKLSA